MKTQEVIENWKAIVAMSQNRVIGVGNKIPWHLPDDFRWFRKCTLHNTIVIGRKTFESLGSKPLPDRTNLVLTRNPKRLQEAHPEVFGTAKLGGSLRSRLEPGQARLKGFGEPDLRLVSSLEFVQSFPGSVFICGGANVYEQALPHCAELLLTRVKRTVEGDAFFPPFESLFDRVEILQDNPEFTIERWVRKPGAS